MRAKASDFITLLQGRTTRNIKPEISDEDAKNLSEEELRALKEARGAQSEADRNSEDSLLLKVRGGWDFLFQPVQLPTFHRRQGKKKLTS
jgi:hypothetical protein